jgi:Na+-translocating ferredoxin:NAD+ oxidoreductase RnfG subunit
MKENIIPAMLRNPLRILLIFLFSAFILVSDGPQLSRESVKKLNKSMDGIFPGHNTHFERLVLNSPDISDKEIMNADGKWFAVKEGEAILGWLMADRIWGRYHEFEYAMIVDTSGSIINISVLSYPASHGNAVTGKKWLSSFNGFSPRQIPVYGRDVDALSGATISGTHLSESIANSLRILHKLDKEGILK